MNTIKTNFVNEDMHMKMLHAARKEVGVKWSVGMTKKALVDAINVKVAEGVADMSQQEKNERMLESTAAVDVVRAIVEQNKEAEVFSKGAKGVLEMLEQKRQKYLNRVSRYHEKKIQVVAFKLYAKEDYQYYSADSNPTVGKMKLIVPRGTMEIGIYNLETKEVDWVDFADFEFDVYNKPKYGANPGNGELTVRIKENEEGELYVTLPKGKSEKSGRYYDIFKVRDFREEFSKKQFNKNLEAALTAFVRVMAGEHKRFNVNNRTTANANCMNCRFMMPVRQFDGVNDDLEREDVGGNALLERLGVDQLLGWGQLMPRGICGVHGHWVDLTATIKVNKSLDMDIKSYTDDEGNVKYLRNAEVLVDGRALTKWDVAAVETEHVASQCEHYHWFGFKSKDEISKEAREEGKSSKYVSKKLYTNAKAESMVVDVRADGEWIENTYPGQVNGFEAFRVRSIGGIAVYGTEEVMSIAEEDFVPGIAQYEGERVEIEKKINMIRHAAFNIRRISKELLEEVCVIALDKPENLDKYQDEKWDTAVYWLKTKLIQWEENEKLKNSNDFVLKFFAGVGQEVEVHVEELMDSAKYRSEKGEFKYRDLDGEGFARYLEEVASEEYVWKVIEEDVSISIVGDMTPQFDEEGEVHFPIERHEFDEFDRQIVADAMQHLLITRIKDVIWKLRRMENAEEELEGFKVSQTVKEYIKKYI